MNRHARRKHAADIRRAQKAARKLAPSHDIPMQAAAAESGDVALRV